MHKFVTKINVLNIFSNVSQIFEVQKQNVYVFTSTIIIKQHRNTHAISVVESGKRVVLKFYL